MNTLIVISTYQKVDALQVLLDSLIEHGYDQNGNRIIVTDDFGGRGYKLERSSNPDHPLFKDNLLDSIDMPSAPEVCKKYGIECLFGKGRGGIAVNKNRGIKYFLEHKEFDYLLLLDDDIVFTSPGFIDLCISSGEPHLTGYLGDPANDTILFGENKSPFFTTFRPQAGNEYIWRCYGCQGMMLFYTRKTIEEVGYMDKMAPGGLYGFEHSLHANRINMLEGRMLDWFPVLKGCHLFFQTQQIPNNYVADYSQNEKYWHKRKSEIMSGIDLRRKRCPEVDK